LQDQIRSEFARELNLNKKDLKNTLKLNSTENLIEKEDNNRFTKYQNKIENYNHTYQDDDEEFGFEEFKLKTQELHNKSKTDVYERLFDQKDSGNKSNTKKSKTNSNRHDSNNRDTSMVRDKENHHSNSRKRSITPKRTNSTTIKPRKTSDRSFNIDKNVNDKLDRKYSANDTFDRNVNNEKVMRSYDKGLSNPVSQSNRTSKILKAKNQINNRLDVLERM